MTDTTIDTTIDTTGDGTRVAGARVKPGDARMRLEIRALADATRHAVFTHLRDAETPLTVAELTAHFQLNHNAIRQHLAALTGAGLVRAERAATTGRGRPPWVYRVAPGAAERWGGASPSETLSMLLLDLLRGDGTPRDVGRRAGARLAGEHRPDAATVDVLEAVARRLGFEPRVEQTRVGADVVLERCPFADPAESAPDIVCQLHHGIAEGIAEAAADSACVDGLVVRPPRRAGCRIRVSVPAPTR